MHALHWKIHRPKINNEDVLYLFNPSARCFQMHDFIYPHQNLGSVSCDDYPNVFKMNISQVKEMMVPYLILSYARIT